MDAVRNRMNGKKNLGELLRANLDPPFGAQGTALEKHSSLFRNPELVTGKHSADDGHYSPDDSYNTPDMGQGTPGQAMSFARIRILITRIGVEGIIGVIASVITNCHILANEQNFLTAKESRKVQNATGDGALLHDWRSWLSAGSLVKNVNNGVKGAPG